MTCLLQSYKSFGMRLGQLTGGLLTYRAANASGGFGRPRVTQLESLSDSFLFGKLSEEFNLSSGGSGSDADQQAR